MRFSEMPINLINTTLSYLSIGDLCKIQLASKYLYNIIHRNSNLWLQESLKCFFTFENSTYCSFSFSENHKNQLNLLKQTISIITHSKKDKWLGLINTFINLTVDWDNLLCYIMPYNSAQKFVKCILLALKDPALPLAPLRREDLGRYCNTSFQVFLCDKIFEENSENQKCRGFLPAPPNLSDHEEYQPEFQGLECLYTSELKLLEELENSDDIVLQLIRWYLYEVNEMNCKVEQHNENLLFQQNQILQEYEHFNQKIQFEKKNQNDQACSSPYFDDNQFLNCQYIQHLEEIQLLSKKQYSNQCQYSDNNNYDVNIISAYHQSYLIQIYELLQKTVNSYCGIILEYILSQNNIYDVLAEYIGRWNAYVASILEFENIFKPFVDLLNKGYNQKFKYHPRFPKFSMWRFMTKLWMQNIYCKLKKDLNFSFLRIMNNHLDKNLSFLMNELKLGNSAKKQYIFDEQFNEVPLSLYLEFKKLKKKVSQFPHELNINNETFQENPYMERELLRLYVQCVIDLSINEVNVHYLGSTKMLFDNPYKNLEKKIIKKSQIFLEDNMSMFMQQPFLFQDFLNSNYNLVSKLLPARTNLQLEKIMVNININFIEMYTKKETEIFINSISRIPNKKDYIQDAYIDYELEEFIVNYLLQNNTKDNCQLPKASLSKIPKNQKSIANAQNDSIASYPQQKQTVRQIIDYLAIYFPKICICYQKLKDKFRQLQDYETEVDYLIFGDNKRRNIPYEMTEIDQCFYVLTKDTSLKQLQDIQEKQLQFKLEQQSLDILDNLSSNEMTLESSIDQLNEEYMNNNNNNNIDESPLTLFSRQTKITKSQDILLQQDIQEQQYQLFSRNNSQIESRDFGEMPSLFSLQDQQSIRSMNFLDNQIPDNQDIDNLDDLPELMLFKK